jgi:multicomponent Na+:H+ antiporter subunit D
VSAYALFRVLYFVLRPEGVVGQTLTLLSWAAAIAIVAGSVLAIAQRDIRRMLAYSSVAQMGYILLGLALGTPAAIIGALLHVLNHAIMKGCLFLIAGGVQWHTGVCKIEDFIGMSRRMPLTMAAFVVAAVSMIGLPPTAGFFSKWYLLTGAIEAHAGMFVAALLLSSLLNAVYVFRVIEVAYLRQPEGAGYGEASRFLRHELPVRMLMPILILATSVVLLGLLNQTVVTQVIQYALPLEGR